MIFDILDTWLIENRSFFLKFNVIIEVDKKEDNKKHSIVLSYNDRMASVELLNSGTIDFIIIDTNSEKIIFTETFEKQNQEELLKKLDLFINKIINSLSV